MATSKFYISIKLRQQLYRTRFDEITLGKYIFNTALFVAEIYPGVI